MIHFFDPSNEKLRAKVADIAPTVDVLLGNLEDAVAVDNKEAARAGLVEVGRNWTRGETQLWTRVNSLDSPWFLDDLMTLVSEIGDKLDVVHLGEKRLVTATAKSNQPTNPKGEMSVLATAPHNFSGRCSLVAESPPYRIAPLYPCLPP
jgi:citrate lyase beta subunit